ncbi:hypothetical protein Gbth_051_011 [Gluconobacter thailandicus F149-1 = NBRC 100600]|nr:hypothetical protein Gbth_051_011 [Gluconobacter thailandicus F149-1 = NBRC 100600]GBR57633.1 hypothetical protein AA100600_0356 [Gluconobacter thailandicus F149-1 = NBRC 100600]GEL88027.1 hypothetical protein GTH01_23850 [Gluconobacter thailandicus F149-1 = NBRC 100600]
MAPVMAVAGMDQVAEVAAEGDQAVRAGGPNRAVQHQSIMT